MFSRIRNYFNIDEKGSSFNVEIFSERIVAFEMILKSNQYHDIFFDEKVNLLKLPLKIKDDNNIIESSFQLAKKSIITKKQERLESTIDAYKEFADKYPESNFLKQANSTKQKTLKLIEILKQS